MAGCNEQGNGLEDGADTADQPSEAEADPTAEPDTLPDPVQEDGAPADSSDGTEASDVEEEEGSGLCSSGSVVFSSDFEDGTLEGMWVDGDVSISTEEARSGTRSALYRFSGAGHWGLTDLPAYREFYVEFWAMFKDMPCEGTCDPAGKHFFRFAWWPNKSIGIQKQIDTGMRSGYVDVWWFDFEVPTTGGSADYGSVVARDRWILVRAATRPNTPGLADGRFTWMLDGTVLIDLTDEFFGAGDELDTFMFTNYDFIPSDGITEPRIFVDDLRFITGPGAFDCLQI
jgi:hypothetical protein